LDNEGKARECRQWGCTVDENRLCETYPVVRLRTGLLTDDWEYKIGEGRDNPGDQVVRPDDVALQPRHKGGHEHGHESEHGYELNGKEEDRNREHCIQTLSHGPHELIEEKDTLIVNVIHVQSREGII
jgi:hypothetical protein